MMKYATLTEKGQITLPAEIRRTLKLEPGKKLNISVQGDNICISKSANITEVRQLLRKQMSQKGTEKTPVQSGDGWAAYVTEKYDSQS